MNIQGLNQLAGLSKIDMPDKETPETPFSVFYDSAINLLNETNQLQKQAEQAGIDFALGKIDNLHTVQIAQEKANIALQYTVQLRNAILDAYNEIMRMQV